LVAARDFSGLAALAESSCLKMHALMMSSRPAMLYWRPATLAGIEALRELQGSGVPVFFTIDAGPQLKAVCLPEAEGAVAQALSDVPGVVSITSVGLGSGARLVT
jgi:diphosphomevalonate decarboxylase